MKIVLYDDLHIENDPMQNWKLADADVCILAGDICVAEHLKPHKTGFRAEHHKKAVTSFLDRVAVKYNHVLYVMGNHEHYQGVFDTTEDTLRHFLKQWPNITLLEKSSIIIDNVYFFGATLWPSCNNNNPITAMVLKKYLNDFSFISRTGGSLFTPEAAYVEHCTSVDALKEHTAKAKLMQEAGDIRAMVVITHHAPSRLSVDDKYKNETQGNFGFYSDLDDLVDNPLISLWCHGHVHIHKDYKIGDTRIVCNPRGYTFENMADISKFVADKVIII